jgi:hypothetical protein
MNGSTARLVPSLRSRSRGVRLLRFHEKARRCQVAGRGRLASVVHGERAWVRGIEESTGRL